MEHASPRFRQDLAVSPTEADGVPCVDVRDPQTGTNFRLYDFEYQLALQLNGQPLAKVTEWASQTYGADLTTDGIREFAAKLAELGFIEQALEESEGDNGAEAAEEWMSPQGAKTAQFVPDPAMLEGAPELTPVASFERATAEIYPTPKPEVGLPLPVTREVPAMQELPAEAFSAPEIPSAPSVTAAPVPEETPAAAATARIDLSEVAGDAPAAAKANWANDLDGALDASDAPATTTPPAPAPVLPPRRSTAAPPPPGLTERRQPPEPESVVMAAFSDDVGKRSGRGRSMVVVVVLLLVAAAAASYWLWSRNKQTAAAPQAVRVRVVAPAPTAAYRWYAARGRVTDHEIKPVAFANPGRLAELLPAGTEVAAGDVIGKLQGASGIETLLAHDRSRVGFYRQLRDSMRAAGNRAELRLAEQRLVEKQKLVEMAVTALARYTVLASEPGEVVETLAKVGMPVVAGVPVARIKGRLLHGAFELDAEERAGFAKLDFCRVEVVGLGPRASNEPASDEAPSALADSSPPEAQGGPRFVDCQPSTQPSTKPSTTAGNSDKLEVALPGDLGLVSGQPLRLARRRYDAVFPVPAAALVAEGEKRAVWIAERDGTAEPRPVGLAALDEEALVSDGLRIGDQVIVDPPAELHAGERVQPDR
jgi:hypothetical protein